MSKSRLWWLVLWTLGRLAVKRKWCILSSNRKRMGVSLFAAIDDLSEQSE
ncbi:MAG: hypothetical protein Q4C05_06945 [Akkermansia sp.]|nr:hypothetical protein [Akkermansia sp.]